MNKAQRYLINAGIDDIVVSGSDSSDPDDWKYLSDVLGEFYLMAAQPTNTADADQPCVHDYVKIPAVACTKCGHVRR